MKVCTISHIFLSRISKRRVSKRDYLPLIEIIMIERIDKDISNQPQKNKHII